jgi:hypothetical protein
MSDLPKRKRKRKAPWFWPLGGLSYSTEVRDFFPEQAELLGTITMLWNRQELALRDCFLNVLEPSVWAYGEAIWNRQSTHQNKRALLSLALEHGKLSKRQQQILDWVIENTKTVADRRNELIHAEYVVHGGTGELHAKVTAPRALKPKHQRLSVRELNKVIEQLDRLLQAPEAAKFELLSPAKRAEFDATMQALKGRGHGNQQNDCRPPSPRRKRGAAKSPPPQSSGA